MLDAGSFRFVRACTQRQNVVKDRGQKIADIHFRHDQHHSSRFQLAVAMPHCPQQLDTAELEPGEIVRVMHPPLAVRLLIADADFNFVGREHSANVGRHSVTCQQLTMHWCHVLSRNNPQRFATLTPERPGGASYHALRPPHKSAMLKGSLSFAAHESALMQAPTLEPSEQDISSPPLAKAKVVLLPRKALPFYGRHPWVLGSAVHKVEALGGKKLKEEKLDGEIVDLYNEKNKFVARGFYNSQSRIRVRLFTWSEGEALDETLFRRRIGQAILLRDQLGYEVIANREQTATRLVFSEGDGLSGLVVDRYGDYLVVQATSLGIAKRLEMIVGILQDLLRPKGIILRADKSMAKLEGVEFIEEEHHWGELPEGPLTIQENGIAFGLDLREGQKTGFYLDQRENRKAAAAYMKGRRVLDMFCYTGGFALAAVKLGGATEALGIDGSKKAIAQAEVNAGLNHLTTCKFEVADAFKTLDRLQGEGTRFDAVVLDPPKFARNRSTVNSALMAYHRVNRQAVDLLEPGGILVTNSCSGSVKREDFLLMLSGVAQKSGRDIQILEVRGAAADHPVSATCLETEYLKCVICRVQ